MWRPANPKSLIWDYSKSEYTAHFGPSALVRAWLTLYGGEAEPSWFCIVKFWVFKKSKIQIVKRVSGFEDSIHVVREWLNRKDRVTKRRKWLVLVVTAKRVGTVLTSGLRPSFARDKFFGMNDPLWWRGGAELVLHCKILGILDRKSVV